MANIQRPAPVVSMPIIAPPIHNKSQIPKQNIMAAVGVIAPPPPPPTTAATANTNTILPPSQHQQQQPQSSQMVSQNNSQNLIGTHFQSQQNLLQYQHSNNPLNVTNMTQQGSNNNNNLNKTHKIKSESVGLLNQNHHKLHNNNRDNKRDASVALIKNLDSRKCKEYLRDEALKLAERYKENPSADNRETQNLIDDINYMVTCVSVSVCVCVCRFFFCV